MEGPNTLTCSVQYKEDLPASTALEHFHGCYELDLIVQANLQLFVDGKTYQLGDRDLIFINENKIHKNVYQLDHSYRRYSIHFSRQFIHSFLMSCGAEAILAQLCRKPVAKITLDPIQFERMRMLFDEIYRQQQRGLTSPEPWARNLMCSTLFLILDTANRLLPITAPDTPSRNKKKQTVHAVVQFVNDNFSEKITLEDLEKQFFLTRYHLCHIFKEETGFTLSAYIQQLRVLEAQKLLRKPNADIATICYQCGFPSIQQFYKVFKKITHQTPRQYKQNTAKSE